MSLPEDPKVRPGVWIFSWPWKTPYDEAVDVHDRNTSKNSFAERSGIPGERVDTNFHEMIDELAKVRKVSFRFRVIGTFFKGAVTVFGRWFTGGRYFKE